MAGKLVEVQTLLERLAALPVDEATRERVRRRILNDARHGTA
jgi:hypothetical protein